MLPLGSPGEVLLHEFLKPRAIADFAKATGIEAETIEAIVDGRIMVDDHVADRFARTLGTTKAFWTNLSTGQEQVARRSRSEPGSLSGMPVPDDFYAPQPDSVLAAFAGDDAESDAKSAMAVDYPPPRRPGASLGTLSYVMPDSSVTDDESLADAIERNGEATTRDLKGLFPTPVEPVPVEAMRPSFASALSEMPDVGRDEDFERPRPRYSRAELLAQCDPTASMPDDLADWEAAAPIGHEWGAVRSLGREFGAIRDIPVVRIRREMTSILRRGEPVSFTRNGLRVAVLIPAPAQQDWDW